MMNVELELARLLYYSLVGDLNEPDEAFILLSILGYTDEAGDWIYDND